MTKKLISVGMTYFNASSTVTQAIESALAQTWENKEIIIVNDGSDDEETRFLDDLKSKFPALHVYHMSENKGVAAARNEIIRQAKGEFLAFFDDDDQSVPERLEKQYKRIVDYEEHYAQNDFVICYSARMQHYPNGQERCEQTMGITEGLAPNGHDVAIRMLTGKPIPNITGSAATCSQMARLSTYKSLDGFDESFRRSEDTEFNVRAALSGAHFVGLATPLVKQKMTLASDKKLSDEKINALNVLTKHKNFIDQHSHYSFCYQWLEMKYDFLEKKKAHFFHKMIKLFLKHPILTVKRLIWSAPNMGFNFRYIKFHHDKK